jgi:hypothetical protein
MRGGFAAVHESAYGPKRTCCRASVMSASKGKADMGACVREGDIPAAAISRSTQQKLPLPMRIMRNYVDLHATTGLDASILHAIALRIKGDCHGQPV